MIETVPPRPTRTRVTTIRSDGSRRFLYPAETRGRFTAGRRVAATLLVAFYAALPFVRVGGYPAVFLDLADRRFHLFGLVLAPQDLWLAFFLISGLGFGLFFVTALFGRIWCGWACPQTVFLDLLFRPWERLTEGDAVARRRLAAAPWTFGKLARRAVKHAGYALLAAAIAHLLLAYFVSLPAVWALMRASPAEHWSLFVLMAAVTGALYFDFAWFREQLCIVLCPYGRLQSALTDEHTLAIGYDTGRVADCVDCLRCVRACPTGIDIRQGLQMECIGCAACIDACDDVMTRLRRPPGLIRYDSLAGLSGRPRRWLRPRIWLYGALLVAGLSAASVSVLAVRPAVLGVTRMIGAPYFVDGPTVRNEALVRVVNKRATPARFVLAVHGLPTGSVVSGAETPLELGPLQEDIRLLVLRVPALQAVRGLSATIEARDESGLVLSRDLPFLAPEAVR